MTTNNKTKAEIKEFNEDVFDALDDNSDGLVTKKDLLEALAFRIDPGFDNLNAVEVCAARIL